MVASLKPNQRTCLTLGLRYPRLVGSDLVDRFVEDQFKSQTRKKIERVFAGDSQHYADEFEVNLVSNDGEDHRTIHWYQSVETDARGILLKLSCLVLTSPNTAPRKNRPES